MNDRLILPREFGNPVRQDGTVIVPAHVAERVLRLLVLALTHAKEDNAGGLVHRDVIAVLEALNVASIRASEQSGSASGTEESKSVSVKVRESPVLAFPGQWLSCSEVAALLECSPRSVRKACEQGRLPATKFGRTWHIAEPDLDAYRFDFPRKVA